ncbi:stage II sporulation protein M [Candidatus Bathyarchaeota archaeon]|nr:stage II sporulation protein M [Candidatus Bathyarchaeota archaeon]
MGLVKGLFSLSKGSLSKRSSLFTLMNIVYFGSLFVVALMTGQQNRLINEWVVGESSGEVNNVVIMFVDIFLFNLVVSGFLLLTVTGLFLFPLPVGILVFRASLWGSLLSQLPTPVFLATFPTFLLEGEAYVIAGVVGINLGLSWLKPNWVSKNGSSKRDALGQAVRECGYLYALVTTLLLAAAVVETFTLYSLK